MKKLEGFLLIAAIGAVALIAVYYAGTVPLAAEAAGIDQASSAAFVPFHEQYRAAPSEIPEHIQAF